MVSGHEWSWGGGGVRSQKTGSLKRKINEHDGSKRMMTSGRLSSEMEVTIEYFREDSLIR